MGGPEYEALAGGETKNLKIVPRKQNNPSFPSYSWICNYEECCTSIILSMLNELRVVLSLGNHPTMVGKILKFLASKHQQNFIPRLKKYNRRLYFYILLISWLCSF